MGRGRAKAKQQKVARELKYGSHFTDLDALQRELGVSGEPSNHVAQGAAEPDGYDGASGSSGAGGYDDDEDDWSRAGR